MVSRAPGWILPREMPAPKRNEAPARTLINHPAPTVDGGRYAPKRCVGDTVKVSADIFRDGHEIMRAVVRYKAPGGRRWLEAPMHAVDAHINGVRWEGEFTVETPGSWQFSIEAWSDVFATWRDEMHRKIDAGQHDLGGELSEGVVLLEAAARPPRTRPTGRRSRPRVATLRDETCPRPPATTRRSAPSSPPPSSASACAPTPPRCQAAADRGRPRARALQLLVRAVPALVGRPQGRRGADPRDRRARLRRPLLHARSTRSAARTARAATTRSSPAPTTPACRTRSAPPRAATTPSTPSWARWTTSSSCAPRPASTAWTWRSTSRSTRRPTTRGWRSTRSGSTAAPTARSSTPRTRPRSTRTSTTSTGTRRPGRSCGRSGGGSCCSGSTPA